MPKQRLYFLLRDNHDGTLSYMVKSGEWPEEPSDVDEEEDNNPDATRPFTHRFRARSHDEAWRMYLVKLVDREPRARRRFLGEKQSERRVRRWAERHARRLRERYGSPTAPSWLLAVRETDCIHIKIL